MGVAEHLNFDMAGAHDGLFENQLAIAEGVLGLAAGAGDHFTQLGHVLAQAHATATATRRGLDHDRHTDGFGLAGQVGIVLVPAFVAGHARHPGIDHLDLGLPLVAHQGDGVGRRADEGDVRIGAGLGKLRVLGQEAIAGMDGVGAGGLCGLDDAVDAQVGLAHRRCADAHGLVGQLDVPGVGIGVGVDRHGRVAGRLCPGDHPAGDLAPVGHQHLGEVRHLSCLPARPSWVCVSR